jgi:hypothetical protein
LKFAVGAAFDFRIYRINRSFVKKRLPTPFPTLSIFQLAAYVHVV